MNTKRLFRQTIRTFLKNWIAYITLVFTLNLILTFIIVPIMRWLTKVIMVQNSVPYVSYTNVGWLFTKRPLAVLELALLAIVILLLVFLAVCIFDSGNRGDSSQSGTAVNAHHAVRPSGHASVTRQQFYLFHSLLCADPAIF